MGARATKGLKFLISSVISLFYCGDEKCILCGEYCEGSICKSCTNTIKVVGVEGYVGKDKDIYPCYSLGYYSYGIKKLILLFKYHKDFEAGRILADYMARYLKEELKLQVDIITYIPSSRDAMKKRGFNQCKFLAEAISKSCDLPLVRTMKRVGRAVDQIGLSSSMRWDNLKDAFRIDLKEDITDKNILIVDDVLTTGATSFYASNLLKEAGAGNIYILTVAKSKV